MDVSKMRATVDAALAEQTRIREEREALRGQFAHYGDNHWLPAEDVDAFLGHYAVKANAYGMIVGGEVVKSDDHFRELVGERDDIDLELVFDDAEHRDVQPIREWLMQHARRG